MIVNLDSNMHSSVKCLTNGHLQDILNGYHSQKHYRPEGEISMPPPTTGSTTLIAITAGGDNDDISLCMSTSANNHHPGLTSNPIISSSYFTPVPTDNFPELVSTAVHGNHSHKSSSSSNPHQHHSLLHLLPIHPDSPTLSNPKSESSANLSHDPHHDHHCLTISSATQSTTQLVTSHVVHMYPSQSEIPSSLTLTDQLHDQNDRSVMDYDRSRSAPSEQYFLLDMPVCKLTGTDRHTLAESGQQHPTIHTHPNPHNHHHHHHHPHQHHHQHHHPEQASDCMNQTSNNPFVSSVGLEPDEFNWDTIV
ncbi:unnamed protein product [Echinostoma caproni]|uniref:GATA-type domain-containing protein n=1 Tax=Echinostoma caproni TaxID=27848 RepID=A0A183B2I7_9TREM|nr:unnamed protein product [Echinostoma caproni]